MTHERTPIKSKLMFRLIQFLKFFSNEGLFDDFTFLPPPLIKRPGEDVRWEPSLRMRVFVDNGSQHTAPVAFAVSFQHRQVLFQRKAALFGSFLSFHFDLKLMLPNIETLQSDDRADRRVLWRLDVWMEHLAAVHEDVVYDLSARPISRGVIEGDNESDAPKHCAKYNARRANVYQISALIEENEGAALVVVIAKFFCGLRDLGSNADMRIECTPAAAGE